MPIHLDALDVVAEVEGSGSALIVACNMCAGASLAMKEGRPFLQFCKSLLKSPPLERHIKKLESQLNGKGVKAKKFKAGIIQQFFLCLWTRRQRSKFHQYAKRYDAVVVPGCDSAIDTVRDSVEGTGCKVIKGTEVAGVMNTRPRFHLPCDISFEDSKMVPMCDRHCKGQRS